MKLLKRKILFCLASEVDFFKISEGFEYYPYKFLYPRLSNFKSSSIRDAALQLVESGEVDKIMRNKTVLFRLTAKGRDRLLSFFPISIGQKKVWDHIWRLAIVKAGPLDTVNKSASGVAARSSQRQGELRKLWSALKKLGFKKLSRGVYLTPLPISKQLKDLILEGKFSVKIAVIESRRVLLGDNKQLAKQIWPLEDLEKDYKNFVNQAKTLLKKIKKQKSLTDKAKTQFFLILDFFFSLLEKDPGLPKKLLPDDWSFDLAKETCLKLANKVKTEQN